MDVDDCHIHLTRTNSFFFLFSFHIFVSVFRTSTHTISHLMGGGVAEHGWVSEPKLCA